jgi:Acetyl/propionyl-CoA carboxylase, alpha subunit
MGITAVAIYSEADKDSLFVKLADETVCIGKSSSDESYLNMIGIINVANLTGCDAVHPGYGFLSENAEFAKLCEECSLKFIGPKYKTISLMGDKSKARKKMSDIGVPVIPGSDGAVTSKLEAKQIAKKIGFPVLLKSAMGGGGKGIRKVDCLEDLESAFYEAQQESIASYNNDEIYIEKLICNAKHIEMQVLADNYGNIVYLPERDCSIQRNHQKVIEESPCLMVSPEERASLGKIVSQATKEISYVNTGTYEFLMDRDHNFYFIEMNTRIQVEYTVTESITGFEL